MELIPNEVVTHIFSFLSPPEMVRMEMVCQLWRNISRTTKWNYLVSPKSIAMLNAFLQNYRFHKYSMAWICNLVTNPILDQMKNCTYLDLSRCSKITDQGIANLRFSQIEILNLSNCVGITNKCVRELIRMSKLHTLYLCQCYQITDYGIMKLGESPKMIPIESQELIHNFEKVQMDSEEIPTESQEQIHNSLKSILRKSQKPRQNLRTCANIRKLFLSGCHKITDKSLAKLKNVDVLNLSYCEQITDEGIKELTGVKVLYLQGSGKGVTNKSIEQLVNTIVYH